MNSQICLNCKIQANFIRDDLSLICPNCGYVAEEDHIESNVEYAKKGNGDEGFARLGRTVNAQNVHHLYKTKSLSGGSFRFQRRSQKEYRVARAEKNLLELMRTKTEALGLGTKYNDEAQQLIQRCINKKITHHSRTTHWLAAILYIIVRNHSLPFTMMDIASLMRVDIWQLARSFSYFVKQQEFHLPPVNPTVLIDRVAHHLFEDRLNSPIHLQTVKLSKMLVEIVKKEQFHSGRRPSALVGAVIKYVAEQLGEKFTYVQIQKIIGFGTESMRMRFKEIKNLVQQSAVRIPVLGQDVQTKHNLKAKIDTVIQWLFVQSGANQNLDMTSSQQRSRDQDSQNVDDAREVLMEFDLDELEAENDGEHLFDFDEEQFSNIEHDAHQSFTDFFSTHNEDTKSPSRRATSDSMLTDTHRREPKPIDVEDESAFTTTVYSSDEEVKYRHVVHIDESDDEDSNNLLKNHLDRKSNYDRFRNITRPPSFHHKLSEEQIQLKLIEQVKKNLSMDYSVDRELKKALGRRYKKELEKMTQSLLLEGESPATILKKNTEHLEYKNKEELSDLLTGSMNHEDLSTFESLLYTDNQARQKRILAGLILNQMEAKGIARRKNKKRRANRSQEQGLGPNQKRQRLYEEECALEEQEEEDDWEDATS